MIPPDLENPESKSTNVTPVDVTRSKSDTTGLPRSRPFRFQANLHLIQRRIADAGRPVFKSRPWWKLR